MAIADILGAILGGAGRKVGSAVGDLGTYSLFGQQGLDRAAQAAQQKASLAQALGIHNDELGVQAAQLAQQGKQQGFGDQMQILQGIASGALQRTQPGETPDIMSPLGLSAKAVPGPKTQQMDILKDSNLGKGLGLEQDVKGIPVEDWLKYATQYAEKGKSSDEAVRKAAEKAATAAVIEKQAGLGHQQVESRFSGDYYKPLYGQADPMAAQWKAAMHEQLETAAATDKKQGSTTQIDQFFRQLREYQSPWEKMKEKQQERQVALSDRASTQADTRADRSYQFHAGELERLSKPYEDSVNRVARLRDTMDSGTIQGDALTPAELMIVMAGGAGSGLRVNEAEINRTLGGRNKADELRAALGQWKPGDSAFQIPPKQKEQMHKLVDLVYNKSSAKLGVLNDARSALAGSNDVSEHRRILDQAHRKLDAVDINGALGTGGTQGRPAIVFPKE